MRKLNVICLLILGIALGLAAIQTWMLQPSKADADRGPFQFNAMREHREHMDHAAFQLTLEREADLQRAGHSPGPTSSIFKYVGSELNKRKFELMMEASGFGSLIWEGTGSARELQLNREWLRSKGNSIEGGTSEIQLNVIAKRVLGLP